ncbi:uncharacterized protein EDB91DRAFT_1336000 [Suillus paluster]|uniref:uncharacterized protein n=1 Tax=Suillus paluster TaxID=48578 RepID=UPI001B86A958|nr:uncharacterized protein EDB91DRAFT_1336000 [Suillus paluster]KAG1742709.1 hypothetical protein EDB91DRAFT_1336000 [Suillus paluster]
MDHAHTPSHPSSSHAAHSAALPQGNTNELNPNPGMYMGMPWSQPAYAPQHYLPYPSQHYLPPPGNATAQGNDPYSFPPNMVPAAAPPYAPVASSSGVGAGNAPSLPSQTYPYSPQLVDIERSTSIQSFVNGALHPAVSLPQEHATAPVQYYQPPLPSGGFAGVPPAYQVQAFHQQNMPPPISQQPYLAQPNGAELTMTSASYSLPQAPASSVSAGQKRVAEDLGDDKASKKSKLPKKISNDPEFVQLPDENGRRVIKCLRCDEKMNSTSYGKHIQTLKHRGLTEGEFICGCGHPYSRIDALERHWKDSPCGKKRKMCKRPSSSIPSQGSTSSASASPAAFPTAPFTFHAPAADVSMSSGSMTSNVAEYVHISPQVTKSQETTTPADPLLSAPVESVDPVVTALFTGWALTELENVQLPPQANEVPSSQEMDVLTDPLWAGASPDQVAEFMQYYDALISQELLQN